MVPAMKPSDAFTKWRTAKLTVPIDELKAHHQRAATPYPPGIR
jgi:hypothetical protein